MSGNQSDLRKMMQGIKANKGTDKTKLKKYKLSQRELQLLQEEKDRKLQKQAESRKRKAANALPDDFFNKLPTKSILKNSGAPKVTRGPVPAKPVANPPISAQSEDASNVPEEVSGNSQELPEGFFDDPKQDAKARQQEYKDPAEEAWAQFQKEMAEELQTTQDLASEEQQNATADRQLEEIDEQMRAWARVNQMEKRLGELEKNKKDEKKTTNVDSLESDQSDEEDAEDMFDWRKKS